MLFSELIVEYTLAKTTGAHHTKVVRANTWEGYSSAIRLYVEPRFGQGEVESVTYDDVQAWVDSFPEGRGAEKAYKCLRQMVRFAITKLRLRIADPTVGVLLPEHSRREGKVLDDRQLNRMLFEMRNEPWEAVVLCQATLGLRRCEACALTWADVNLGTGVVSVTKGRHVVGGKVFTWGTKTKKSTREVVLPWFAVERLREIKRERRALNSELLCDLRPDAISRRFRSWCRSHGFVGFTMMQLRHSFATIAVKAGVPIEVVAMMLGHSDLRMCYERYVCSSESLFRSAIKRWAGAVLGSAPRSRLDDVSPSWSVRRAALVVA
jgi:integrase